MCSSVAIRYAIGTPFGSLFLSLLGGAVMDTDFAKRDGQYFFLIPSLENHFVIFSGIFRYPSKTSFGIFFGIFRISIF